MALINYEGHYHKIETVDLINNTVNISKWESSSHRQQGDSSFKTHQNLQVHLVNLYDFLKNTPEDKSILDNIKTVAYTELQKELIYNEMGFDVIPTVPEPENNIEQ